jgi:hypothetical protein
LSDINDAWGSPGYVVLAAACDRAASYHQTYELLGHLPLLERAIVDFSTVLDVARNVDLRSAAANGLGTALWSRYERFGDPG